MLKSSEKTELIKRTILNELFMIATSDDNFRLWFYPNCTKGINRNYEINHEVHELISECINDELTITESVNKIHTTAL